MHHIGVILVPLMNEMQPRRALGPAVAGELHLVGIKEAIATRLGRATYKQGTVHRAQHGEDRAPAKNVHVVP